MTDETKRETSTASEAAGAADAAGPVEANLLQFLSGLGAQTLMHLGLMSNPLEGDATTVDLPNAKYSIDLLGVLETKTEGNRTEEEDRYLKAMLRDLRLRYVQVASKDENAAEAAETPAGADGSPSSDTETDDTNGSDAREE